MKVTILSNPTGLPKAAPHVRTVTAQPTPPAEQWVRDHMTHNKVRIQLADRADPRNT